MEAKSTGTDAGGMSRRQFIALAGAVAGVAAFLLATKGKPLQGLLQTQTANQPQLVRGRYVKTAPSGAGGSLLTKLLGGKF